MSCWRITGVFHNNPTKDSVMIIPKALTSDNYGCVGNLGGLLTYRGELLYHPSCVTSCNFSFSFILVCQYKLPLEYVSNNSSCFNIFFAIILLGCNTHAHTRLYEERNDLCSVFFFQCY